MSYQSQQQIKWMSHNTCSSSNSLSPIEQKILYYNKHAATPILRRLHNLRNKHQAKLNLNRTPHPTRTFHVIYALYNMSQYNSTILYIGKTKGNCITRRRAHIHKALNNDNRPAAQWIRHVKPDNVGIIPLQSVPSWNLAHHFERFWIHKLATHKLHPEFYLPLNIHSEHAPYKHVNRSKSKNSQPSPAQTQRTHPSDHPLARSLYHLFTTISNNPNNPPPSLKNTSNNKLYKLFSILNNKLVTRYQQPKKLSPHNIFSNIHQLITTKHPPHHIKLLSTYISAQIDINNENYTQLPIRKRSTQNMSVIVLKHIHPHLNDIKFYHTLRQHQHLLPQPAQSISIKLTFKNNKPTSHTLFNFNSTLAEINSIYFPSITCICHTLNNSPYLRSHGHVDTLDPTVILLYANCNNNHLLAQLIQLFHYGTKFIPTPSTTPAQLRHEIKHSLTSFAGKLSKRFKLDPSEFKDWLTTTQATLSQNINNLQLPAYQNDILQLPQIKTIIKTLHQHLVINTADKLPNNYTFTCKFYWLKVMYQSTLSSPSYKLTKHTESAIIEQHKTYLKQLNIKTFSRIPTKRIQFKYHKDGHRPLIAAVNCTTTVLCKLFAIALTALIDVLKKQANEFYKLHGYTWFFDIESTPQLLDWLRELNNTPNHIPKLVHTADASGFYDCFRHKNLIDLLYKEIPPLFKSIRRSFLYCSATTKSYKWTNTPEPHTKYSYTFSSIGLARLLCWRLANQHIAVGSLILKQTIGVGQGDNHSGHLVRFAAIIYERNFMLTLHNTNPSLAKEFAFTKRKHDDLIFLNNSTLPNYLHIKRNSPIHSHLYHINHSLTTQPINSKP